ncbi:hypothetical protein CERZMDRAFT_91997 [Cercospora zeae-maydis SCOH1-5]|uniref:Cyanovirin-N domain-containing protein n=1 Tax=Cercospora zeae-maydis SCOH1-5 TaxID=717836 RepID=A0A6A6EXQ0_9PEZI|nr:hypothetical protein CERZMDRAFT_91997 [Cercospora zeae-maydis SCOH1-5]
MRLLLAATLAGLAASTPVDLVKPQEIHQRDGSQPYLLIGTSDGRTLHLACDATASDCVGVDDGESFVSLTIMPPTESGIEWSICLGAWLSFYNIEHNRCPANWRSARVFGGTYWANTTDGQPMADDESADALYACKSGLTEDQCTYWNDS